MNYALLGCGCISDQSCKMKRSTLVQSENTEIIMNGIFLHFLWLDSSFSLDNGVWKKIKSQVTTLSEFPVNCIIKLLPSDNVHILNHQFIFLLKYMFKGMFYYKELKQFDYKNIDFIYIRRPVIILPKMISFFKKYKENNPNGKILYEIPTYPYDFEHRTIKGRFLLIFDRHYRKQLRKYVDRIVTLTDDKEIFGCRTLKITNGVDVNTIPVNIKRTFNPNQINLIAVSQFSFWHGYERVIKGIYEYYKNNGTVDIKFNLVGNGKEIEKYRKLVMDYNLQDYVIFYGTLFGDKLTDVFNSSDIALCSLACHKIGLHVSSILKSREYLCRGLPLVTSTKIDIIPYNFKYALHIPEDDSPVDINAVINFARHVYNDGQRKKITSEIRDFAEHNCDMKTAMTSVIEYLKENINVKES